MGLYILPRYKMKTTSEPLVRVPASTMRAPNHNTRAVPMATMISTIGDSLAFRLARLQRDLDRFQALFLQAPLFVLFARESLHHADGREHFLDDGDDLAFFLAHLARRLLDQARVAVDHDEQRRRHGEGDQREAPVDVEHHADHADQRQAVDHHAQQAGSDEALDGIDIAGDAADQVAGLLLIVIGERQALDMRIERLPQIVHDPLADAGGKILFGVGADGVEDRDHQDGDGGELQDAEFVVARRGSR